MSKRLRDVLVAAAAWGAYGLLAALPIDAASGLGGWLGRSIGPHLSVSRRARRNLKTCFPEKSDAEIEAIVRGMWDNLGRVVGEFPHVAHLDLSGGGQRVTIDGIEHFDRLRDDGKPGIFIGGHIGNWELAGAVAAARGLPLAMIYRAANNPYVEKLYRRGRADGAAELIPKGPAGARRILDVLKGGGHLALLVDQKMNDGIAVPFFGRDAMTAPALAQFALKFRCPVVPARVERLKGAHFRITVLPPLEFAETGNRHADIQAAMTQVNALIEAWIRDRPEQWLWLHKRWPD